VEVKLLGRVKRKLGSKVYRNTVGLLGRRRAERPSRKQVRNRTDTRQHQRGGPDIFPGKGSLTPELQVL
jgi:hypothetical protein